MSRYSLGENYKKDKVIREDDLIVIDNPEMFLRCGYDKTIKSMTEIIDKEDGEEIRELCGSIIDSVFHKEAKESGDGRKLRIVRLDDDCFDAMRKDIYKSVRSHLAYRKLNVSKSSGDKRKIFTIHNPKFANKLFRVLDVSVKKTGVYDAGYFHRDYFGDHDYEPPALYDQKTHRVLFICEEPRKYYQKPKFMGGGSFEIYDPKIHDIKIEACHVRKIHFDLRWSMPCKCRDKRVEEMTGKSVKDINLKRCIFKWTPCENFDQDCGYSLEHLLYDEEGEKDTWEPNEDFK